MKIGDKVHYIPYEGCDEEDYENGIIKEIIFPSTSLARVVYHCASEWEHYTDYTSALTDISQLREGWINGCDKSPSGKHEYTLSPDSFEQPYCKYCYKEN